MKDKKKKGINKWFNKFNNWFERVTAQYTEGVKKSIKGCEVHRDPAAVWFVSGHILCSRKTNRFYSFRRRWQFICYLPIASRFVDRPIGRRDEQVNAGSVIYARRGALCGLVWIKRGHQCQQFQQRNDLLSAQTLG